MRNLAARGIEKIVSFLPARIAARIDLLRPGVREGFGVFNGQQRREEVVGSLFSQHQFDLVIETGTYRGTTTEYLRGLTTAPIVSIEVSERYFLYAQKRLAPLRDVRVIHGESPVEIRRLVTSPTYDRQDRVFAYLDAHWGRSLPVRWEILELLSGWDSVCIVIDDFRVPGDPGYAYDDYGPGLILETDLLAGLPLTGVSMFYPRARSAEETGHRRGWVVLGRGTALVSQLSKIDGLAVADGPESALRNTELASM